jgi:hypothetical protein
LKLLRLDDNGIEAGVDISDARMGVAIAAGTTMEAVATVVESSSISAMLALNVSTVLVAMLY